MRAVHFAATLLAAGVVFFIVFIAEPAFAHKRSVDRCALRRACGTGSPGIAWISLVVAVLSGAAWLVLTAAVDERTAAGGRVVAEA